MAATIDYYTDEGQLIALLAMASKQKTDRSTFFSAAREGKPFVRTFPGSLFTYQFGSVWLDTLDLGTDDPHDPKIPPINYFQNTRAAILATQRTR